MADETKFCFITCVNNEDEYREALFYINNLKVPAGYAFECIAVRGAASMAAGYQAAMERSDAKYKLYLHQDVHIVNKDFLDGLLQVFAADAAIGMVGMAGATQAMKAGIWWQQRYAGLAYGCVYQTKEGKPYLNNFAVDPLVPYKEVEQLDGLLLATQTDLPWRSDLFRGWHFYDLSQSAEFIRKGYKLAVPSQVRDAEIAPWCLHNGDNGGMGEAWEAGRQTYLQEYADLLSK